MAPIGGCKMLVPKGIGNKPTNFPRGKILSLGWELGGLGKAAAALLLMRHLRLDDEVGKLIAGTRYAIQIDCSSMKTLRE
jgi:hypothetical protein